MTTNTVLFKNVPYKADQDFVPLTFLADTDTFLMVPAKSNIRNIQDLMREAKANPQSTDWDSWDVGSSAHLALSTMESTFHARSPMCLT